MIRAKKTTKVVLRVPSDCYFIPDAHHAIPFEWDDGTATYVAPPWFDAILGYKSEGTSIDPETGDWIDPPTEFYVWLHGGTVKYTIKAHYEDVWENRFDVSEDDVSEDIVQIVSAHESQENGGYGIPYYGLVEKIEDRYGNQIRMHYCEAGNIHLRQRCNRHLH